jgi:membrane-associated phospholipid phosphatase
MSAERRSPATAVLLSGLTCAILVGLSMLFLDRAISSWSHAHTRDIREFVWLTWIVEPVPYLAAGGLIGAAVAAVAGWRPGPKGRLWLTICLATLVALVLKEQLKHIVGRTWPETWVNNNPSWIAQGIFTFQPLHGGQGWASFPSGHTTLTAAPMSVLWLAFPRLRWLWASPVLLVAIGLLGADFHWLSDIIAGGFLGAACGWGMTALLRETKPMVDLTSPKNPTGNPLP